MAEQLWHTHVALDVVLDEQPMRLSDLVALKPGDRILLNTSAGAGALRQRVTVRGAGRPPQEPISPQTVLIVDDYKMMLRIIRNPLKQIEIDNVDEASDGAEALSKLRCGSYGW